MNQKFEEPIHLEYLVDFSSFIHRLLRIAGGQGKTTITRYYILKILEQKGKQNLTEISEFLLLKKNALSQLLDRMYKDGLIERCTDTVDRRKLILSISQKGTDTIKEFEEAFSSNLKKYSMNIPENEQAELRNSMGQFVGILRKYKHEIDKYFSNYSIEPEEII
jgi:DNA-binding MarR family transcriptional regulator